MKRARIIVVLCVLIVAMTGCKNRINKQGKTQLSSTPGPVNPITGEPSPKVTSAITPAEEAILPPVRYGSEKLAKAMYFDGFSVEKGAKECDFIGRVRIGDWLGEGYEGRITYFNAEVIKPIKGDTISRIVLCQDGGSAYFLYGYPLFQAGDELLIFANKASGDELPFDNLYMLPNGSENLLFVVQTEAGDLFYADTFGKLGKTIKGVQNYKTDDSIRKSVRASFEKNDTLLADVCLSNSGFSFIFDADEVDYLIEQYLK